MVSNTPSAVSGGFKELTLPTKDSRPEGCIELSTKKTSLLFDAIRKPEGNLSILTLDSLCDHVLKHGSLPAPANLEVDVAVAEVDRTTIVVEESDSEEDESDMRSLQSAIANDDIFSDTENEECDDDGCL